jgi:hypothetical protein
MPATAPHLLTLDHLFVLFSEYDTTVEGSNSSVYIVTGMWAGQVGSWGLISDGVSLVSTASRPSVGSTQPPTHFRLFNSELCRKRGERGDEGKKMKMRIRRRNGQGDRERKGEGTEGMQDKYEKTEEKNNNMKKEELEEESNEEEEAKMEYMFS